MTIAISLRPDPQQPMTGYEKEQLHFRQMHEEIMAEARACRAARRDALAGRLLDRMRPRRRVT